MAKRGKKYAKSAELIDKDSEYTLDQACKLVKQAKIASFDESVDLDIRLGVDPRHADQMVRGTVSLPHGTGRSVRVLALVNEAKQAEATEAGADHVGLDDYIAKIEEGWAEIDVIVATPDVMGKLGKLGRVLGPRGLMPNPKSGTVTMDVKEAVESFKSGKIDFRVDKAGILHTSIGKTSFNEEALRENAATLISTIIKMKPSSSKGTYIKSAFMSSTMGPSIPLNRSTISSL